MKRSMATAESEEYFGDEHLDPAVGRAAASCEAKHRVASLLKQLAALAWPVLLGYSEAEPLVRNSHMVGSQRKSHMRLIGGWCSHRWSDCHQRWPLDLEVTGGRLWKVASSCVHTLNYLSQCVVILLLAWHLSSEQNSVILDKVNFSSVIMGHKI